MPAGAGRAIHLQLHGTPTRTSARARVALTHHIETQRTDPRGRTPQFLCAWCHQGEETMERSTAGWRGIISTAIANLIVEHNFTEKVRPAEAPLRGVVRCSSEGERVRGVAACFGWSAPPSVVQQKGQHCAVHRQALGSAVHQPRPNSHVVVDGGHLPLNGHWRPVRLVRTAPRCHSPPPAARHGKTKQTTARDHARLRLPATRCASYAIVRSAVSAKTRRAPQGPSSR